MKARNEPWIASVVLVAPVTRCWKFQPKDPPSITSAHANHALSSTRHTDMLSSPSWGCSSSWVGTLPVAVRIWFQLVIIYINLPCLLPIHAPNCQVHHQVAMSLVASRCCCRWLPDWLQQWLRLRVLSSLQTGGEEAPKEGVRIYQKLEVGMDI